MRNGDATRRYSYLEVLFTMFERRGGLAGLPGMRMKTENVRGGPVERRPHPVTVAGTKRRMTSRSARTIRRTSGCANTSTRAHGKFGFRFFSEAARLGPSAPEIGRKFLSNRRADRPGHLREFPRR